VFEHQILHFAVVPGLESPRGERGGHGVEYRVCRPG
jgi:hypothetical protein